jgi:hypothetical protein
LKDNVILAGKNLANHGARAHAQDVVAGIPRVLSISNGGSIEARINISRDKGLTPGTV